MDAGPENADVCHRCLDPLKIRGLNRLSDARTAPGCPQSRQSVRHDERDRFDARTCERPHSLRSSRSTIRLIAIANHLGRIDDESNLCWIEGNGHPTMGLEWGGDT